LFGGFGHNTLPESATQKPVWGLDYIFTISGGTRIVSTDPIDLYRSVVKKQHVCAAINHAILRDVIGFLGIATIKRSL